MYTCLFATAATASIHNQQQFRHRDEQITVMECCSLDEEVLVLIHITNEIN